MRAQLILSRMADDNGGAPAATSEKRKHWNAGPERKHWKHLYHEIVATEVCVGCSACVVACPHDVIEMTELLRPKQIDESDPPDYCVHGEQSCSLCAMACLRLEPNLDKIEDMLFGRRRKHPSEIYGQNRGMWLGRTTSDDIRKVGQDGGVVSAIVGWMLENGELDGACVAMPDPEKPWFDKAAVVKTREDMLKSSGSRYTYCNTPLALKEAAAMKLKKVAVVGVSCESTALAEMAAEGIKRWSRMTKFVAGLMCNETFKYEEFIFGIVRDKYKVDIDKIVKINVKGDVFVTLDDGTDVKIPLDECKVTSNDWCHHCPDFSAEHADISFGGIGLSGWTICIIRSEYGLDVWNRAVEAGIIETKPAEEDPEGIRVLEVLSKKQRRRTGPLESHAAARWPVKRVLDKAKKEFVEEQLEAMSAGSGNGKVETPQEAPSA
jgi:coenzyme F420 hydrogenase subunit beta